MTLADKILSFHKNFKVPPILPDGIKVLNPYSNPTSFQLAEQFYRKFYDDNEPRILILGINPGRFGGGVTGIPFTDPIKLEKNCGLQNNLQKRAELSADFIYEVIECFGGAANFYSSFYINSVFPFGFTKNGLNLNYYDDRALQQLVLPYVVQSLKTQIQFGMKQEKVFCLGEGKNFQFLSKLNEELSLFSHLVPLAHPRYIMQYRRKEKERFVDHYAEQLRLALTS